MTEENKELEAQEKKRRATEIEELTTEGKKLGIDFDYDKLDNASMRYVLRDEINTRKQK